LSTPEQKCIGWPEQKYINNAGKKAPELGAFSSGIKPAWDYSPRYRLHKLTGCCGLVGLDPPVLLKIFHHHRAITGTLTTLRVDAVNFF
jgi:hypothetical protein